MPREVFVVEYKVQEEWEVYDTEFTRKDAETYLNLLIEESTDENTNLNYRLIKYVPESV